MFIVFADTIIIILLLVEIWILYLAEQNQALSMSILIHELRKIEKKLK